MTKLPPIYLSTSIILDILILYKLPTPRSTEGGVYERGGDTGLLCLFSLKNPGNPERVFPAPCGVTCVHLHPKVRVAPKNLRQNASSLQCKFVHIEKQVLVSSKAPMRPMARKLESQKSRKSKVKVKNQKSR